MERPQQIKTEQVWEDNIWKAFPQRNRGEFARSLVEHIRNLPGTFLITAVRTDIKAYRMAVALLKEPSDEEKEKIDEIYEQTNAKNGRTMIRRPIVTSFLKYDSVTGKCRPKNHTGSDLVLWSMDEKLIR